MFTIDSVSQVLHFDECRVHDFNLVRLVIYELVIYVILNGVIVYKWKLRQYVMNCTRSQSYSDIKPLT